MKQAFTDLLVPTAKMLIKRVLGDSLSLFGGVFVGAFHYHWALPIAGILLAIAGLS